jgi:hypothetical protein
MGECFLPNPWLNLTDGQLALPVNRLFTVADVYENCQAFEDIWPYLQRDPNAFAKFVRLEVWGTSTTICSLWRPSKICAPDDLRYKNARGQSPSHMFQVGVLHLSSEYPMLKLSLGVNGYIESLGFTGGVALERLVKYITDNEPTFKLDAGSVRCKDGCSVDVYSDSTGLAGLYNIVDVRDGSKWCFQDLINELS